MIRSTIFNVCFYSFTFLIAMTVYVLAKISTRHAMWRVLRFWGKSVLWMMRSILNSHVEVRGLERLDHSRPQLIVSKHQSELDIVMLGALMWDVSAVAMEELTRLPFFGGILKKLDIVTIAVDAGPQGRTEQAIAGARRIKEQGRTMVIYPEGTLMKLGAKERYRRGVGHIYKAMEVEAVPVAVSLGVIWPQRQWRKNAGTRAAIEFLEPIGPGLDFEHFMDEIEQRIEGRTIELIEEHASGAMLEEARERYRQGLGNDPL